MLILVVSSDILCLDGREQGLKEAKESKVAEQKGWASGRIGCGLYRATPRSETTQAPFLYLDNSVRVGNPRLHILMVINV